MLSDYNILIINRIDDTNNEIKVQGKYFSNFDSLFLEPCDSKKLCIYSKKNRASKLITVGTKSIKSNVYIFPIQTDNFITVSLLQYNN